MRILITTAFLTLAGMSQAAAATLGIFACEPEWGALARELGGDKVSVYVATTGLQDPHQIQARPSLIARARNADLTVCTGAELEIGWLPMILRQAANPRIQPGSPGSFEAAGQVRLLVDVPARLDRADGDVHAAGNPHVQTDPRNIAAIAGPLSARLMAIDPANAVYYQARRQDFDARWSAAMARWDAAAAPLRGVRVAVSHRNWLYLQDWLGLVEGVALEPKPGVPPSAGYLAEVLVRVEREPVRMVLVAAYEDPRPAQFLSERAKVPMATLPFTVGGSDPSTDLFSFFDDTLNRLLKALGHHG